MNMALLRQVTVGVTVVVAVLLVAAAAWWVFALPSRYTAAQTTVIQAPLNDVFSAVSDGKVPGSTWGNPGDGSVSAAAASQFRHEVVESEAPWWFVTTFVKDAPVSGTSTWTFEEVEPGATRVTLVHEATIPDLITRAHWGLTLAGRADVERQLLALRSAFIGGEST